MEIFYLPGKKNNVVWTTINTVISWVDCCCVEHSMQCRTSHKGIRIRNCTFAVMCSRTFFQHQLKSLNKFISPKGASYSQSWTRSMRLQYFQYNKYWHKYNCSSDRGEIISIRSNAVRNSVHFSPLFSLVILSPFIYFFSWNWSVCLLFA